jgi:hypothetical protein
MRRLILAAAALTAGILSAAAGPPGSDVYNPATRIICVDVDGQTRPAVCQTTASRLDGRDDICRCPVGRRVDAPVCASGERPPPASRAFNRARQLASGDGSLVGDLYRGRPMCVAPRNR